MRNILIAATIFLVGCGNGQFVTPEKDADRAFNAGDRSLLGVYRFVISVPGVSGDYEKLRTKYNIRVLEGTSDVIIENDNNSFNKRASRYAEAYNKLILRRLGCDARNPMMPCVKPK